MYIDLTDVLRSPGNVTEKSIDIQPARLDDMEIVEPVRGTVRVENARQSVVVSGRARTAIRMQCGRCLREYAQPLDLEIEAVAPLNFLRPLPMGEVDEEIEADDELAAIFSEHTLDVLELIRQAAVLQSPIQPLCAVDCEGLPEARSYQSGPDERWGALRHWVTADNGSDEIEPVGDG